MKFEINDINESNKFLNLLLENVTSAIFVVDKENKIYNVNKSMEILFNKKGEEFLGNYCGNAIGCINVYNKKIRCGHSPQCSSCGLRTSILDVMSKNVPTTKKLLSRGFFIDNNVHEKHFQYSTRSLQYKNEQMVLIIIDDITEIVHRKNQLEKINNQLNKTVAIAAHDLRNPVSIIQMYMQLLKTKLDISDTKINEIFNIILDTSNNMIELLEEILDLSRISNESLNLEKEEINYIEYLNRIIGYNRVLASSKEINIEIENNSKTNQLIVFMDRKKIGQVLSNYISNAIKYSEKGTLIKVKVSVENHSVKTEVIDQGRGIRESELENLFKPFQTTSTATTAGESSFGLGLAIVKNIVKSHKGEVGVKSEIGKGSNFFFTIPIQ